VRGIRARLLVPLLVAVLVPAAGVGPAASLAAGAAEASPFSGTALWITQLPALATPAQLASEAAQARARTVFVKAAEGSTPELQFSSALVSGLRSAGVSVCAWTFVSGEDALAEAAAAALAVHDGAQCLVIDAESTYEGRYGAAQAFERALRSQLGSGFPIALAGEAEVLEHPRFPYSVFLGPGGFGYDMPQLYWLDLGVSVQAAYAATIGVNAIFGRPIVPVGQLYGGPAAGELESFRALAGAYGLPGASFFDLDVAQPQELEALAVAPAKLAPRAITPPTIHAGADGDEIVWAQELLNAAGARLPVGGYFGEQTARAVSRFQARQHLRSDGLLGPATWRALLRLRAREPSWAQRPPDSASGG
jgi:hypothetical protein